MSRTIIRRAQARIDALDIAMYIGQDDEAAAQRFLIAVEESLEFLADFPESGGRLESKRKRLNGLRYWPVRGFKNHLILFKPSEQNIEVIRVVQGSRDLEALFDN